ncbi:hypothetical protein [Ferruginibacter sp.]|nr:hypothetical protein [Ferruginibacter sp.]
MNTKNINPRDSVLAITLLLLLLQWKFAFKYGLPVIAVFILIALLSKPFAAICHRGWMLLAKLLNAISSFVILFIVYVLIVLPTAIYVYLFKKSGIKFKSVNNQSNFISINKQYSNTDFSRPW